MDRVLYSHRPLTADELGRGRSPDEVVGLNGRCHPDAGLLASLEVDVGGVALAFSCAACRAPVIALATSSLAELRPCLCGATASLAAYVVRPPAAAVTCAGCRKHQLLPVLTGGGPTPPDEPPACVLEDVTSARGN